MRAYFVRYGAPLVLIGLAAFFMSAYLLFQLWASLPRWEVLALFIVTSLWIGGCEPNWRWLVVPWITFPVSAIAIQVWDVICPYRWTMFILAVCLATLCHVSKTTKQSTTGFSN